MMMLLGRRGYGQVFVRWYRHRDLVAMLLLRPVPKKKRLR